MKKSNKKTIALSIVAFVLVLMSLISFTYSWIDDIKLVEFTNDNLASENAPLKTGIDINSTINITQADATINLGNILTNSDITYTYTEGDKEKQHIKYNHNGSSDQRTPNMNDINSKKGYFYESGDMHLSPCYGDGESFYFQKSQNAYREGNIDDENVNYISFTAKVTSPYASVDFWFSEAPSISGFDKDGDSVDISNYARYAVIADGEKHVYSNTGNAATCNSSMTGLEGVSGVRNPANYVYYTTPSNNNNPPDRGYNGNTVFSVHKGETVYLTIKIWLENGFSSEVTATDISFNLVSSWAFNRRITISDKTTSPDDGISWIAHNSATLFLTCPSILETMAADKFASPTVDDWQSLPRVAGFSKAPFYPLTIDSTTHTGYVDIPLAFNDEELILYRCKAAHDDATGWNEGTHSGNSGDHGVTYWNWWKTNLPNNYLDATYTLYGCSHDTSVFGDTLTYKGYGTWGSVEKIQVYSHYQVDDQSGTDWASSNQRNYKLYVRDYTDEKTSGEIYTYTMFRENDNSTTPWEVYVPINSSKLQFSHYYDNGIKGVWGYNSWHGDCPQQRPLQSNLYASNSTVYHFTANDSTSSDNSQGRGFWEGANLVYCIRKNFFDGDTLHAYMYWKISDSNKRENESFPGPTMTATRNYNNTANIYYKNDTNKQVFSSGAVYSAGYKDVIFSDGYTGDEHQTNDLVLFTGCFYLPGSNGGNGKWLGSLDDEGRAAKDSDDEGSGSNTGEATEITTTEPTQEGVYLFGKLSGGGSYVEYAKFSSTSANGYVIMYLDSSKTYQIMVRKGKKSSGWTEIGTEVSDQTIPLSSASTGNQDWGFSTSYRQKVNLRATNSGYYKISIKEINDTYINLKFAYN